MGFALSGELLVFTPRALAVYDALVPGAHRFRQDCAAAGLPGGWLLPGWHSLADEDEPEQIGPVSVAALAAAGDLGPDAAFDDAERALAALVSRGGPTVLLTDETHAGLLVQEHALAFRDGRALAGSGDWGMGRRGHWRWSRQEGLTDRAAPSPIADAAARLLPAFQGARLFDGYLPRGTGRGLSRPQPPMALPEVTALLQR